MMMTEAVPSSLYYDRLSGQPAYQPETKFTLLGRWALHPAARDEVFINSAPVAHGDFLVPDAAGTWVVIDGAGTRIQGSVARSQLLEDLEAESIRIIGTHLSEMIDLRKNWLEWADVVPLVPGMSEQVELLLLDQRIREHFGYLVAVCLRPRAHLYVEVERLPVSKARRIAPGASSYLASHTEDWDRPLIRGILPKRILSEVRHDQVDIYENRVVARLLDHLSVYLGRRIRLLKKLLKVFQEKEDYSSSTGGTYQRQKRILGLWGESIDTNEGRRKALATLKELEWLKYKLMGLMDSKLYREVPRRSFVPNTLRMTNILSNDQNYRRVAELWQEWSNAGFSRTKSPRELNAESQQLCGSVDAFSMLLVIRSLETLGYEPVEKDWETPVCIGGTIHLVTYGIDTSVQWQKNGAIRIQVEDSSLLILPLTIDLSKSSSDEQVQAALARIYDAARARNSKVLVLYVASSDVANDSISLKLRQAIHTVGNHPFAGESGIGLLPVSPWDIGSMERVARALRWFLDSARFNHYPVAIDIQPSARQVVKSWRAEWLVITNDGDHIEVRRPPKDFEWEQLSISNTLDEARRAVKVAERERERITDELKRAVRSQGKTGILSQEKKTAHQQLIESRKALVAFKALASDIEYAKIYSTALLVCPTCGAKADAGQDFEARAHGSFQCRCKGCGTIWATRMCSLGHKYAVMLPSSSFLEPPNDEPGWEDRVYGSDLLALPAKKTDGEWGFVCPDCGEIT